MRRTIALPAGRKESAPCSVILGSELTATVADRALCWASQCQRVRKRCMENRCEGEEGEAANEDDHPLMNTHKD